MKGMVSFIKEINQRLLDSIALQVKMGYDIEIKDHFGKFTMDNIATCGFGVDAQSFATEESPFVKNAKQVFRRTTMENLTLPLVFIPGYMSLMRALKVPLLKVNLYCFTCLKQIPLEQ